MSNTAAPGATRAAVTTDAAGNVTVRLPVFAAGSRAGQVWLTGAAIVFGAIVISQFLDGGFFSAWYAAPIVLEIVYIWLIVSFGYKTSILSRNGTYRQGVTFLPPLVRPKPGAAAVCFEKVFGGGVPSGNYYYPVQVRFPDGTAYDLVYSAGGLEEARVLATAVGEATGLPVEPRIPRSVSGGRATLILIVVAMCAFPIVYVISLVLFTHAGK